MRAWLCARPRHLAASLAHCAHPFAACGTPSAACSLPPACTCMHPPLRTLRCAVQAHWHEELAAFCDWGFHANEGEFVPHVMVKCTSPDGNSALEHPVRDLENPRCPRSHPRYLFPLGDGQGGARPQLHQ